MIPLRYDPNNCTKGEGILFDRFNKSKNTDNCYIMHSYLLQDHRNQKYGEIDFLILAPNYGIFIIEVKSSHTIKVNKGTWYFYNKKGGLDYKKHISPFKQANENMHALRNMLCEKNSNYKSLIFGHAVIFNNWSGNFESPEIKPYMIYDENDLNIKTIDQIIKNISNGFLNDKYHGQDKALPSKDNIDEIKDILRPDFEFKISLKKTVQDNKENIIKYTKEQCGILDIVNSNKQILVNGPAGTGKTFIAIELAKNLAFEKKSVLFLCFNKLLSKQLGTEFDENEKKYIEINNIDSFTKKHTEKIISDKNINLDPQIEEKLIEKFDSGNFKLYDYIIVDEYQDMAGAKYLDFFDIILKNGFKEGNWRLFGDFKYQCINNNSNMADFIIDLIDLIHKDPFICELSKNCRNTISISNDAVIMSNLIKSPYKSYYNDKGALVNKYFYDSVEEQIAAINNEIKTLLKNKIDPSLITLLSIRNIDDNFLKKINYEIIDIRNESNIANLQKISYSTIQSFKGLENEIIIIIDINELDKNYNKELLYTACTRAKYSLTKLIHKSQKKTYDRFVSNYLLENVL